MVCLHVEGNAFFSKIILTLMFVITKSSFQASANKRQKSATDFPVIVYRTKKINNAFGYLFI
jgi:hypothetical protein